VETAADAVFFWGILFVVIAVIMRSGKRAVTTSERPGIFLYLHVLDVGLHLAVVLRLRAHVTLGIVRVLIGLLPVGMELVIVG
jgi:hypothetical protein